MERSYFQTTLFIVAMVTRALADYDCACNYDVEAPVYSAPDSGSQPLGYLYEFDCKPISNDKGDDFVAVQYEKQVGYIIKSSQVQAQICPGLPPAGDLVTTTTLITSPKTTKITTSTTTPTITISTTTPTTPSSTTPTTTSTTTPTTSTTTPTATLTTTPTTTSTTTPTTTSTATPTTTSTTTPTTTSTTTPTTTSTTTIKPTTTAAPSPVTWPIGTYGLMQTRQGCPGGNTRWVAGWRKQDTEDSDSHNYFTAGIQNFLNGQFASNNLATSFCIKDTVKTSKYDKNWPSGSYCILKHKACPAGFRSGFIFWDDEDSSNGNSHGGALPDGVYDGNTKIYYCCRGDGYANSEIVLPTERPFILLRYGTVCQSVRGMSVRDVYVRWDDEDTLNSSGRGGVHPFDDGGNKDHILHFCYYHSQAGPSFVG